MGRIILVYGVIGGLIVAALMQLTFWLLPVHGGPLGMFIGFTTMFIAFSMILVGVRQYRDQHGGGVITFKRGALIGLGIALIASLFYVGSWETYLAVSGKDYMGEMTAKMLADAQATGDALKVAEAARQGAEWRAIYANPLSRMGMTLTEIFPLGIVVALVIALLVKNPRFLPARARAAAA